jgi:serine/threonine protein kinase
MAPELLTGANLDSTANLDIWSMGCILYAFVFGKLPFQGKSVEEILENMNKNIKFPKTIIYNNQASSVFPGYEEKVSAPPIAEENKIMRELKVSLDCKNLIKKMLNPNPKERIEIQDIYSHPWYQEYLKKNEENPLSETEDDGLKLNLMRARITSSKKPKT